MYTLKIKKISVVNESGDVVVIVTCYLIDSSGIAFKNSNDELDVFTIRAPKSSIPTSGYLAYLTGLAQDQIALKYKQNLTGVGTNGSNLLSLSENDLKKVFIAHTVAGVGITSTLQVNSLKSTTQALLSGNLTLQFTGNTTSPSFTKTGDVTISSNVITGMSSTTGISGGMVVQGLGIPSGSTVLAVNSISEIIMTQNALASNTGTTLTFSTDPESEYLTSLSPTIFTQSYVGLVVSGPSIPLNTTIREVISTSRVRLFANATATTTGGTYIISGSPTYTFTTGSWTVDYTSLQKVVDIIDFTEL